VLGPLVTGFRKGLANCQQDKAPQAKRLPLPAPMMLSILELTEGLLPSVHWDIRDPKLLLLRTTVASIVSYLFFNRGECSACALSSDLIVDDKYITLLLRKEKGRKNAQEENMRARQIPCDGVPIVAAMLATFITRAKAMGQRARC
jgi:hypothetical protein